MLLINYPFLIIKTGLNSMIAALKDSLNAHKFLQQEDIDLNNIYYEYHNL